NNYNDSGLFQHGGTAIGTLTFTSDRIQSAGAVTGFSPGSTNNVDLGNLPSVDGASALTVCSWINVPPNGAGVIASKASASNNASWQLSALSSNQEIGWMVATGSNLTSAQVINENYNDGAWHHVCGVYDSAGGSNNVRLYFDGKLVGAGTTTGAIASSAYH